MKDSQPSYFPKRFLALRPQFNEVFAQFKEADFDHYAEPTWALRDALRDPVPAWHQMSNIPDELKAQAPVAHKLKSGEADMVAFDSPEAEAWRDWIAKAMPYTLNYPRLEEELEAFKALIDYQRAGSHIYSFAPGLAQTLSRREVSALLRGFLAMPNLSFYLHFGPQAAIELPWYLYAAKHNLRLEQQAATGKRYLLDGAFLNEVSYQCLEITLTFRCPDDNFSAQLPVTDDLRFPVATLTLDFGSGVDRGLQCRLEEATLVFADLWDANSGPGELNYGRMQELLEEGDFEFDSERDQYELYDKAINLIANAVLNIHKHHHQIHTKDNIHFCGVAIEESGQR